MIVINTILNANSTGSAARSISTAEQYRDINDDCAVFITRKGKGKGKVKRLDNPIWPTKPLSHARQYVQDFIFRHPDLEYPASSAL